MKHTLTATALSAAMLLGCAGSVRVMHGGLGDGRVTSNPAGLDCTDNCEHKFNTRGNVVLTAQALPGNTFAGWLGNCLGAGTSPTCTVNLSNYQSATALFEPTPFPQMTGALTGELLATFLTTEAAVVNTPARMLKAIDGPGRDLRRNWILMARSESLQTGTASTPRLIVVSPDARQMLSFTLADDPSFPHASTNKVEYLEFDGNRNAFRFHEIDFSTGRGVVSVDKPECVQCHAGRPNWDSYDSWGGMLPFNRDRVHKGSIEAAMLRAVLDLKGRTGHHRDLLGQLELPSVMSRVQGGAFDTRIRYGFDDDPVVLAEPDVNTLPGTSPATASYPPGAAPSPIRQGGPHHTLVNSVASPASDEGRGVDLFDALSPINALRVARELNDHPRTPVDVRPIALAVVANCNLPSALTAGQRSFFESRHGGLSLAGVRTDTAARKRMLPKLKADLHTLALQDMIQQVGSLTAQGTDASPERLRQELFRRPSAGFVADPATGLMVDREDYGDETTKVSDLRFFLEPLGVPVSKWSLSVHGRSRTYTFADLFGPHYINAIRNTMASSLGVSSGNCAAILDLARPQLANAAAITAAPRFAEVQGIFTRHCLECHGQFSLPSGGGGPYQPILLAGPTRRADLLATVAGRQMIAPGNLGASVLYQRISNMAAPMPPSNNGPMLSQHDIELVRRWIVAGAPN